MSPLLPGATTPEATEERAVAGEFFQKPESVPPRLLPPPTTGATWERAVAVSYFTLNQFVWIIVGGAFLVLLIVGLAVPCCPCVRRDEGRLRGNVVCLYVLAWFLPGLDVGSIVLTWLSDQRKACTSLLGALEFIFVVFCFPAAAVLDCAFFPAPLAPGVDSFGAPFFLLLLAIPGYYGALLLFGLPRVLIFCHDEEAQTDTFAVNPHAQHSSVALNSFAPPAASSPPSPKQMAAPLYSNAYCVFPPEPLSAWILFVILAALSVVVLGLSANQLWFTQAVNTLAQLLDQTDEWYAANCLGKLRGRLPQYTACTHETYSLASSLFSLSCA
jgi:hypothetical protein